MARHLTEGRRQNARCNKRFTGDMTTYLWILDMIQIKNRCRHRLSSGQYIELVFLFVFVELIFHPLAQVTEIVAKSKFKTKQ